MRTSNGWLKQWTVSNAPADDGVDRRVINLALVVVANSAIAMSVAALFSRKALLGIRMLDAGEGGPAALHSVACIIVPPWGAKKQGNFGFTAQVPFTDDMVQQLADLTHGMLLEIALENAEHELELDAEQTAVLAFVAGE